MSEAVDRALKEAEEVPCRCGRSLGCRGDIEAFFARPVAKVGDVNWVRCGKWDAKESCWIEGCGALMQRGSNGVYFFLGRKEWRRVSRFKDPRR